MKNITMMNPTQVTRVRFASWRAADRRLSIGVRGAFYAPMHKTFATKDVAYLPTWRPPV